MTTTAPSARWTRPRVAAAFGVTERILGGWTARGLLATPARGPGNPYPWHREICQVAWLAQLRRHRLTTPAGQDRRWLDAEDAAGGYRLRHAGALYGIRPVGGRWREATLADLGRQTRPYTFATVPYHPEVPPCPGRESRCGTDFGSTSTEQIPMPAGRGSGSATTGATDGPP